MDLFIHRSTAHRQLVNQLVRLLLQLMHLAKRLGKQVGSLASSFANLVSGPADPVSGADFANLVSELANQVSRAHCYDKSFFLLLARPRFFLFGERGGY